MRDVRILLGLELRALFGINKAMHTKDKKERNRYILLAVAWLVLIAAVFSYVGGLVFGLCSLGLGDIVPAYLTVLSSVLILAFGIFTAGSRLFGGRGYDILSSLPLRPRSIVWSRFLSMYLADLLLTLAVFLPGTVVYGFCARPLPFFYPLMLAGAMLVPAIPLVASALVGTLVLAITARSRNRSLWQSLLLVLLVVGIVVGSFLLSNTAEDFTPEHLAALLQTAGEMLGRVYPPAHWLAVAVLEGNPLAFGLFALLSVAVTVLALWILTISFLGIRRRLGTTATGHDYRIGAMQSRGLLKALYVREAKRYFSSSIYVTNTIVGPVLGAIMAVALAVAGVDTVTGVLPVEIDPAGLAPFALSAVFCMMTTTSVSISMEGKSVWVIRSLPIPAKTLFDSKILFNLSLMAFPYAVSAVAMTLALRPGPLELLWILLIPAVTMLFSTVLGITVNLRFHRFDWEREEAVVKQSLSAMLGGFAGFFVALLGGAATFLAPPALAPIAKAVFCILLSVGTALLYAHNNRARMEDL